VSDPVLDDETAGKRPVELYSFTIGATSFRLTSANRDVVHGGQIYTVDAIERSPTEVPAVRSSGDRALEIFIRVDHPIVKRWFWNGVPPKAATVVVTRLFESGAYEPIWQGALVALDCDKSGQAKLHVSNQLGPPTRKRLPVITAGRQCQNVLFDDACGVDETAFRVSTTVLAVDGRRVRIDYGSTDFDFDYFELGKFTHVASGEKMTIRKQEDDNSGVTTLAWLELQAPIYGMKVGDSILATAGCFHSNVACFAKFDNILNFVGMPAMPTRNPFFQWALGIMERK
jgi:hypothetical protein